MGLSLSSAAASLFLCFASTDHDHDHEDDHEDDYKDDHDNDNVIMMTFSTAAVEEQRNCSRGTGNSYGSRL